MRPPLRSRSPSLAGFIRTAQHVTRRRAFGCNPTALCRTPHAEQATDAPRRQRSLPLVRPSISRFRLSQHARSVGVLYGTRVYGTRAGQGRRRTCSYIPGVNRTNVSSACDAPSRPTRRYLHGITSVRNALRAGQHVTGDSARASILNPRYASNPPESARTLTSSPPRPPRRSHGADSRSTSAWSACWLAHEQDTACRRHHRNVVPCQLWYHAVVRRR